MRGLNWFYRLILKLFVRLTVQGKAYLLPKTNRLYVLETSRSSHKHLLVNALRGAGNRIPEQQILCSAHESSHSLRIRVEAHLDKLSFLDNEQDIEIVPVSIYHGRMPLREMSTLNILYAESWDSSGKFGHLMQLLVNGRQTLMQIDPPLSLRHLQKEAGPQPAGVVAHKAARVFQNHFFRRRQAIVGPDLSHRRTLIKLILQDTEVKQCIHTQALANNQTLEEMEKSALSILEGIAANFSPTTARISSPFLNMFWRKVYSNIQVIGVEKVQECATDYQIVYLPCHKSHMDYVILSWNLYQHGLMIPHVAAGDNLNVPILGNLLKRGGAIFMRRSFQNDPLYTQVFKSYFNHMANRGHSLEYFIEGGRSRTGRLLAPKTGLLAMTIDNYLKAPERKVAIVPVWISYDKLVESKSYQKELTGGEKSRESFTDLLKTLKLFSHSFGEAAISFGDPILLNNEIAAEQPLKPSTHWVANETLRRINSAIYANQMAIIATALLTSRTLSFDLSELCELIEEIRVLLKRLPNSPAGIASGSPLDWLNEAQKRNQLSIHNGKVILSEEQAREMTFYRNQLHAITVLPGVYLLLTRRYTKPRPQTMPRLLKTVYPYLQAELFLPWKEEDLSKVSRKLRTSMEKQALILRDDANMRVNETPLAIALMRTAEPILLRYYIVFRLLENNRTLSREFIIADTLRIAEKLHSYFGFQSPEYTDERLVERFIDTLVSQEVLLEESGLVSCNINNSALLKRAKQVLTSGCIETVEQSLYPR